MSRQLPPSKFGAGTTYGDAGQAHALPPPQASTPPPPSYPLTPDPYATNAHQAPPGPDPYTATSYPTSTPDPYPAPQFAAPASYSSAVPASVYSAAPAGGAGGGTAITAAILSLVGALWYGIDTVRNWQSIEFVFRSAGELSNIGLSSSATAWAYGYMASVIGQLIFVLLLLLGGILLLTRSSAGRVMVQIGSLLVIAANAYWALAAFQTVGWLNTFTDSTGIGRVTSGEFVARILLNTGLPALIAIVTLILSLTGSTKLWCRRATRVTY